MTNLMDVIVAVAVFAVLLVLVMLMGKAIGRQEGKARAAEAAAAAEKAVPVARENKGELLAAISAAIAEEMGTSVSAIRILALKRVA